MKELRVIIAGSRDFDDFPKLMNSCIDILFKITEQHSDLNKIRIVSDTARGADRQGEQYAKIAGYGVSRFPADWDTFGESCWLCKKSQMAKYAIADGNYGVLIAFWDGKSKGIKHMIDIAKKNGLEVHIVRFGDEKIRE